MGEEMIMQWVSVEHHRLHQIELWPDSLRKRAALSATHSALEGLTRDSRFSEPFSACAVCERKKSAALAEATGLHVVRSAADRAA